MTLTLKAARINMNLTQEEAANLLGINLYTLQNYETEKTFPDVPIIKRIEKIYGISFADINFFPSKNTF